MLGEIHVQHEAAPHVLQSPQTGGVAGLVELADHVPQLGVQLQELLERAGKTRRWR